MYSVLTDKLLKDYQAMIQERTNIVQNLTAELKKAFGELDTILINGKKLPDSIIAQIKDELTKEYCSEYSVKDLDSKIEYLQNYIVESEKQI